MTITAIATAFSKGQFAQTYSHLAENITWTIVEENTFEGKDAVIQNCEQVSRYFQSVTTHFTTENIITNSNKVVINGTAEFLRNEQRVAFVSACDVYEFDTGGKLARITSYCIQQK